MKKLVVRIVKVVKNFIKYLNYGGVVEVTVTQIGYPEILKGKKVLVTGGSSGIGFQIAKKCLETGAEVIITGRNINNLKDARNKLDNCKLYILEWDIKEIEMIDNKISETINILGGRLDIVFNNAGIDSYTNFFETDIETYNKVMDTNLKGLFFIAQGVSKYFMKNKLNGKIINISSIRGIYGTSEPYGISKWGVMGLTKGMGRDLAPNGIIVNGIAPGVTATPINGIDIKENAYRSTPKDNRSSLPEEIAEIAIFLASDAANHIIGEVIVCDGGESLR